MKNKYPILYTSKEINFQHRGLGTLKDCIEAEVIEERNGAFELELTYPVGSFLFEKLIRGNLIKSDASENQKDQLFRVYRITKNHNNRTKVIARHISFDLMYDFIESIVLENASCEYALNQIFRNTTFCTDYKGYSNIVNAQNYSMQYTNPLSAIAGKEGSIIDTYGTGPEILRDNKNIHVLNARGKNNSVLIAYRKNLTGLEAVEDDSNMITRIFPYAKKTVDGNETVITLNEKYVDSPRIFNYQYPYIKEIDFSSYFGSDEEVTQAKLKLKAEQYFIKNKCDIPKINYKIQFIPLSKTLNYESEYKCLETVDLCDTVIIRDSRYNIDTEAKVIKRRYNPITGQITGIELGEPKATLGDLIGSGGGESTQGPPGPPGPQGPAGQDGNLGDFPNSLPNVPTLTATPMGLASIELTWTYESKVYYEYELYASKIKDFSPNAFNLIFKGQASTFLHQVQPNETWYYKARAVNTYGIGTEFSMQVRAETYKISDAAVWFEEAAIGDAVIGQLSLDRGWVGQLKGNWIDAKQLSVTDGNGKRTLDIDSFGNVNLDVTTLKIKANDVATQSHVSQIAGEIRTEVGNTFKNYSTKSEVIQTANDITYKFSNSGGSNLIKNSKFKKNMDYFWGYPSMPKRYQNNQAIYTDAGQRWGLYQSIDCRKNTNYTLSSFLSVEGNCGSAYVVIELPQENYRAAKGNYINPGANGTSTATITTGNSTSMNIYISVSSNNNSGGFVTWFDDFCCYEGSVKLPWQPHSEEIYNGKTQIDSNGVTIFNGAIDVRDNGGNSVLKGDSSGNLNFTGNLNPASGRVNLFGNDCRIDGTANAIRLQLNPRTYIAVDDQGYFRLYNGNSQNGSKYVSIGYAADNHTMFFNDRTMLKMLGGSTPQVQARNAGDNAYCSIASSDFINASSEDYKVNVEEPTDINFTKILMETDIKKYNLKDEVENISNTPMLLPETGEDTSIKADTKLGVILEDLTPEVRGLLNPNGTDGISMYNMISILWKTCQLQEERIKALEIKIGGA